MVAFTVLAFIGDMIGIFPFLQGFIATIFWFIVGVYFWMKGMGIVNGKRLAAAGVSWLISWAPVLQSIPLEMALGIIAVFVITRIEEKTGISITSLVGGKGIKNLNGVRAPQKPRPLNQSGIRLPNAE